METHFLTRSFEACGSIAGCCSPDACPIFMAYQPLLADTAMAGDVLEIGRFIANMQRFHEDLSFLATLTAHSATLRRADLGSGFSFCHIDGGHSVAYCNPAFPGGGEAAIRFNLEQPGMRRPIAIGFNGVSWTKDLGNPTALVQLTAIGDRTDGTETGLVAGSAC